MWSALIGLALVPLYLKYLGVESFGLVGFLATMQGVLQLLDLGLAPTINREVARSSATGDLRQAGRLLHTLAVVYWGVALVIALCVVAAAPSIAAHWLHPKGLSRATVEHAVMLMGLIICCHWPIALYQGALVGAQRLTLTSGTGMVMTTLSSFGAVAILAFVSPTVEALFLWQALVGCLYTATLRLLAWRVIGRSKETAFDKDELKRIWRFSAGMSGVAVGSLVLMQMDKVLLSKMLSLEEFGRYALAGVVASGLYVILTPTYNVIYPRLSALVVAGDSLKLQEFYSRGSRYLASVLFPIAIVAALFLKDAIALWTGNANLAAAVAPVASVMLFGTALNGVMHFPYALQLACGETRLPAIICFTMIVMLAPLIFFLATDFGAVGGALSWLIVNALYLFLGSWLTHRSLLRGGLRRWLSFDIGVPLAISLLVSGGIGVELRTLHLGQGGNLAVAALLVAVNVATNVAWSSRSF